MLLFVWFLHLFCVFCSHNFKKQVFIIKTYQLLNNNNDRNFKGDK